MARKPKKVWNPKYNKVWVRMAMQNALSKDLHMGIQVNEKKFIKEVLAECDEKALELEEQKDDQE